MDGTKFEFFRIIVVEPFVDYSIQKSFWGECLASYSGQILDVNVF
jgi:hypothetical protein